MDMLKRPAFVGVLAGVLGLIVGIVFGLYYAYYHVDFTNAGSYTITASDTTPPAGVTIANGTNHVTITP